MRVSVGCQAVSSAVQPCFFGSPSALLFGSPSALLEVQPLRLEHGFSMFLKKDVCGLTNNRNLRQLEEVSEAGKTAHAVKGDKLCRW